MSPNFAPLILVSITIDTTPGTGVIYLRYYHSYHTVCKYLLWMFVFSTKLSTIHTVQAMYCHCGLASTWKDLCGDETGKVLTLDWNQYQRCTGLCYTNSWHYIKLYLVFNVGNYRRKNVGARQSHTFFDPTNKDAIEQRMWVYSNVCYPLMCILTVGICVVQHYICHYVLLCNVIT